MHARNSSDSGIDLADLGVDPDRSFASSAMSSTAGAASSSKAVLAALRALQEKIRRLEAERSQSFDECTQLRHQLKTLELENEHAKQRESLAAQKSLQETRSSYDRLLTEKTDLEIRLSKIEDQNRESQKYSEELQKNIRILEEDKQKAMSRIKDLEAQYVQLQSLMESSQLKEKDLSNTLVWDTKRHDTEVESLSTRIRLLQEDLSNFSREKSQTDTKIMELDQLVAQLLSVNDSLVAQLSGRNLGKKKSTSPSKTDGAKKKKAVASTKRKESWPRTAMMTTASFDASKSNTNGKKQSHLVTVKSDEIEHLKQLHDMYSNIARNVANRSDQNVSEKKSTRSKSPSSKAKNSTRLSSKKALTSSKSYTSLSGAETMDHEPNFHSSYLRDNCNTSTSSEEIIDRRSRDKSDIQAVISSLEDEFDLLNQQYRRLLSSVQSESPSIESTRANELIDVIHSLHRKGEQLRALKSPHKEP